MNRRRKFDGHTSASGVVAALGFFCVCGGVGGDVGGARWELSCKTSCTTVFGTVLNIFTVFDFRLRMQYIRYLAWY